jgi:hypothetical protein
MTASLLSEATTRAKYRVVRGELAETVFDLSLCGHVDKTLK